MIAVPDPFVISILKWNWFDGIFVDFKNQQVFSLQLQRRDMRQDLWICGNLDLIKISLLGLRANIDTDGLSSIVYPHSDLTPLLLAKATRVMITSLLNDVLNSTVSDSPDSMIFLISMFHLTKSGMIWILSLFSLSECKHALKLLKHPCQDYHISSNSMIVPQFPWSKFQIGPGKNLGYIIRLPQLPSITPDVLLTFQAIPFYSFTSSNDTLST